MPWTVRISSHLDSRQTRFSQHSAFFSPSRNPSRRKCSSTRFFCSAAKSFPTTFQCKKRNAAKIILTPITLGTACHPPVCQSHQNKGSAPTINAIARIFLRGDADALETSPFAVGNFEITMSAGFAFPASSKISQHIPGCRSTLASPNARALSKLSNNKNVASRGRSNGTPSAERAVVPSARRKNTAHCHGFKCKFQSRGRRASSYTFTWRPLARSPAITMSSRKIAINITHPRRRISGMNQGFEPRERQSTLPSRFFRNRLGAPLCAWL
jgi:hypothetical protein